MAQGLPGHRRRCAASEGVLEVRPSYNNPSQDSRNNQHARTHRTAGPAAPAQVTWDYAPLGGNLCYEPSVAAGLLPPGFTRVGGAFVKAQYRQYTDSSFKVRTAFVVC